MSEYTERRLFALTDESIIELFFARNEDAIAETAKKYGAYLFSLASNFLHNDADADEAVSDTYLGAWNTIPPTRPKILRYYLSRLTRNAALDKLDYRTAQKRGGDSSMEELDECIPDNRSNVQEVIEERELGRLVNSFLYTISKEDAAVFVGRCFYGFSIHDLARRWRLSERQVKYRLSITRKKLKQYLIRKGVTL